VEATKTHSNNEKPLHYNENKHLFEKFQDKIIHVIVDDYPQYEDSWTYERYQRNQIKSALVHCHPEDVIIISDADEIPNPETILKAQEMPGINILEQTLFYYYFNMVNLKDRKWLWGSRILKYKDFVQSASDIRCSKEGTVVPNGGWHFSYIGGADRIITKIESFCHQELNQDQFKEKETLEKRIERGEDLYGRKKMKLKFQAIPLDDSFPKYLLENVDKFAPFIREPEKATLWSKIQRLF